MALYGKGKKEDLLVLAKELSLVVSDDMTIHTIREMIFKYEKFDEELIKSLITCIVDDRKKKEEMEEKIRLQEYEERKRKDELELERIKSQATQPQAMHQSEEKSQPCRELIHMMPKFDMKTDDIVLYLSLFERQAKRFQVKENFWASALLMLLPSDINNIIAREGEECFENYKQVKTVLLNRFKLSAESFRKKFVSHQKREEQSWKDFTYEMCSYFQEWIDGLEVKDFESLKELIITDQIKKRVPAPMREHFVDDWALMKTPLDLSEKLDSYESVRENGRPLKGKEYKQWNKPFTFENSYEKKRQSFHEPSEERFRNNDVRRRNESFENLRSNTDIRGYDSRKTFYCYECGAKDHLRPQCPKLKKPKDLSNLNRIIEFATEEDKYLSKFITKAYVNGYGMKVLRDTGSSIDIICRKYVSPKMYTGESILVQQLLDENPICLPLAQVKISLPSGDVHTKAAVIRDEHDKGCYIMGNRTASLLTKDQLEDISPPCEINAIQTRSQREHLRTEKKVECEDVIPELISMPNEYPDVDLKKFTKIVKQRMEREQIEKEREKLHRHAEVRDAPSSKLPFNGRGGGSPHVRRKPPYDSPVKRAAPRYGPYTSFHREKFSEESKFSYPRDHSYCKKPNIGHADFRREKVDMPPSEYAKREERRKVTYHGGQEPRVYSRNDFRGGPPQGPSFSPREGPNKT